MFGNDLPVDPIADVTAEALPAKPGGVPLTCVRTQAGHLGDGRRECNRAKVGHQAASLTVDHRIQYTAVGHRNHRCARGLRFYGHDSEILDGGKQKASRIGVKVTELVITRRLDNLDVNGCPIRQDAKAISIGPSASDFHWHTDQLPGFDNKVEILVRDPPTNSQQVVASLWYSMLPEKFHSDRRRNYRRIATPKTLDARRDCGAVCSISINRPSCPQVQVAKHRFCWLRVWRDAPTVNVGAPQVAGRTVYVR